MPQDEDAQTARTRPSVLFGAACDAEHHVTDGTTDRLETDLDLVRDAGFTVVRVGSATRATRASRAATPEAATAPATGCPSGRGRSRP